MVTSIVILLADAWWANHITPQTQIQNIIYKNSPPFPALWELCSFFLICFSLPFILGFGLDLILDPQCYYFIYLRGYTIWIAFLIIEFGYVNHIVTRRRSWFSGRHDGYSDFISVFLLATFAYIGGPFLHQSPPILFSGYESIYQV